MQFKGRYERAKGRLLGDPSLCPENRKLFDEFFADEEYKLKRINGLETLDDPAYKTLLTYILRLRLLNRWFANKPWTDLERTDIQRVFDALEDGGIKSKKGQSATVTDASIRLCVAAIRNGWEGEAGERSAALLPWSRELKFAMSPSRPFALVEVAIRIDQKLLIWLAFDVGENVGTLVRLQKRDFARKENPDTREIEYIVNLPQNS